jgi:hypothetical protein
VADPISKLRASPAKITHFRHCLQTLLVLFTLCQSTILGNPVGEWGCSSHGPCLHRREFRG